MADKNGRRQLDAPDELQNFSPDDDDLMSDGDLVDVTGGPKDISDAALYAYSTVLANWLKTPNESMFEYIKAGALRNPGQQQAWLLSVMWCEFDFNAFARKRYGIIEVVQSFIERLISQAETSDEDGLTAGLADAVRIALDYAETYTRAKATAARLEQKPTRGRDREYVQEVQDAWAVLTNQMSATREEVGDLPSAARRAFGLRIYEVYVQTTITDDEAEGMNVSSYDVTRVKKRLAAGGKPNECRDELMLSWRVGYDLYLSSLSSGDEWRDQGLLAITNGQGFMPPARGDTKGWRKIANAFKSQAGGDGHGDRDRFNRRR